MKIQNSQIELSNRHYSASRLTEKASLRFWNETAQPKEPAIPTGNPDQLKLSSSAKQLQPIPKETEISDESQLSPMDKLKSLLVHALVKALTGRDFKLFDPAELAKAMDQATGSEPSVPTAAAQRPSPSTGYGLQYDSYVSRYEYESVSFSAEGVIHTSDGQEINFSVDLNLTREFYSEQSLTVRAGDGAKIDPLVLNFQGSAAQLSSTRFAFDIDSDGRSEQLSLLKPGSGFLALDRNGDNLINDGRELFGPGSGDGFKELGGYDSDGNRFIDENDTVYDKLRIWSIGEDGSQQLMALGKAGVGAIYLGHLSTPFSHRDGENREQGQTRSSGIFLENDGKPGSIQQVDFVA